jgi:hypothetical protein
MGGTLSASSGGRNRGATISFTIPLLQQECAASSSSASPPQHRASRISAAAVAAAAALAGAPGAATPPRGPMRVLVAEDDPLCAAVMRKMLERLGGVAATIVGDGVAAVAAYERGASLCTARCACRRCVDGCARSLAKMQRALFCIRRRSGAAVPPHPSGRAQCVAARACRST